MKKWEKPGVLSLNLTQTETCGKEVSPLAWVPTKYSCEFNPSHYCSDVSTENNLCPTVGCPGRVIVICQTWVS